MAKRKTARRGKPNRSARKTAGAKRSGKRPTPKRRPIRAARRKARPAAKTSVPKAAKSAARKVPRLERARRTLEETVPTPPSALNLPRHGSAVRTGRKALNHDLKEHGEMPAVTGGDPDANWGQAYFSGDEAPGGDNPTPDQAIVDDIGKALGVEYHDNEELKGTDKVVQRDKHRWELDPASAEDYKDSK